MIELNDFEHYSSGTVISFEDGSKILVREKIEYTAKEDDLYHTVQQGDTLTYLAWYYYRTVTNNSPKYWRYISDANNIINPLDLSSYIGKSIVIPDFHSIKLKE